MALGFTNLVTNGSGTDTNSYATASISPTANRILLAVIGSTRLSGSPASEPTLSGGGVSEWTSVATVTQGNERLTIFRAAVGASPGSGAVTISFAENQTVCAWSIVEVTNSKTSGTNGADATGQIISDVDLGPVTTFTITLGSALESGSMHFAGFFVPTSGQTFAGDTTELVIGQHSSTGRSLASAYEPNGNQGLTLDWTSVGEVLAIGVEVKLEGGAPAGGTPFFTSVDAKRI